MEWLNVNLRLSIKTTNLKFKSDKQILDKKKINMCFFCIGSLSN